MKLDLSKEYKPYYTAKPKPEFLDIGPVAYLSIRGKGDPSDPEFLAHIHALYPVAYNIKFAAKAQGKDFVVAKLEGQWWYDEDRYAGVTIEDAPVKIPRCEWEYRLLIRLPDYIDATAVDNAIERVKAKKQLAHLADVTLHQIPAGTVVQMLHVGPFDKEPATLLQMQVFMQENRMLRNGLHHEVYLSDFNKTAPEKLRTILREPVRKP